MKQLHTKQLSKILTLYKEIGIDNFISNKSQKKLNVSSYSKKIKEEKMKDTLLKKENVSCLLSTKDTSSYVNKLASSISSIEELRKSIESFEGCHLKKTAQNTVFSDGVETAPVMIVGEAPGADEDRIGKPFVGASGKLLDKIFNLIGLSRNKNIYISNIIPWRPPGNRQPTSDEIAICLPFITRHIELINPHILVLAGGVAAKSLLNTNDGIMKLRGKWFNFFNSKTNNSIKTIPIFHPAYLLRSPSQKSNIWQDILNLKNQLQELKLL